MCLRDGAGCIRQSNVNVNDIPGIGLPLIITPDILQVVMVRPKYYL